MVEGAKSVLELLASRYQVTHLLGTEAFFQDNDDLTAKLNGIVATITEKQLAAISSLKSNDSVLAVARYLPQTPFTLEHDEYCIALDRVRDPGNLGTIIRIADWYGITKLACSTDCADFYNPKVIQASMGSFTRIAAYYDDLKSLLAGQKVYGTALQGENVHNLEFSKGGIILIGNEAQGISEDLNSLVSTWISIPRFGNAESLNAAVATAVVCDNLLRSR